jgi:hypothetical protein
VNIRVDSPLLAEILNERRRIREAMRPRGPVPEKPARSRPYRPTPMPSLPHPQPPVFPSLPKQRIKTVEERLGEAEKFRGQIPNWEVKEIRRNILESAMDRGEIPPIGYHPFREPEPEITSPGVPKIKDIQELVASHFNVSRAEILSVRQTRRASHPRQIAMYLSRLLTPLSLPIIGRLFGGRDHTTVLHAARKYERLVETDKDLAGEIAALSQELLS